MSVTAQKNLQEEIHLSSVVKMQPDELINKRSAFYVSAAHSFRQVDVFVCAVISSRRGA